MCKDSSHLLIERHNRPNHRTCRNNGPRPATAKFDIRSSTCKSHASEYVMTGPRSIQNDGQA
eukprot:1645117-Karenia_brevis.AAC.1